MRFLTSLALFVASTGVALACEGNPNCTHEKCNMPATNTASALPADGTHVKLAVAGMKCGSCADKVAAALKGVEGVKGATVDPKTGVAEVSYDSAKTSTDKLLAAVAKDGHFTATVKTN